MSFIAALDQSGGSTPGALERYGYSNVTNLTKEQQMELIDEMRVRVVSSNAFDKQYIDSAILFEDTFNKGNVPRVLTEKGIKTFLKVDKGLQHFGGMVPFEARGEALKAIKFGAVGTKMRSVVHTIDHLSFVLSQQFDYANIIAATGLTPIVEPEVDINNPDKSEIEAALKESLKVYLDRMQEGNRVILKLTIPNNPTLYSDLIEHPAVERIVALSGGYSTIEACDLLTSCPNMDASFSRALLEGLKVDMSEAVFDHTLAVNILNIDLACKKTG